MTRHVSPARPHPVSGLMASARVYITVSRSGEMWSPCRTVSSPVLTMAVISDGRDHLDHAPQEPGGTDTAGQRGDHRERSPDPGRRLWIGGRPSGAGYRGPPTVASGPDRRCARLRPCRRSDLPRPTRTGWPSDSTPRRCWADRPGSEPSAPAPSRAWPACPRCRRLGLRRELAPTPAASPPWSPAGVSHRQRAMPARPLHAAWAHCVPASGGVVHRRARTSSTAPTSWCHRPARGPGGDGARPDRGAVPRAVRSGHAGLPRSRSAGPWPRGRGSTRLRTSSPTRWWPSCPSIPSGSGPSTTGSLRSPRPGARTPDRPIALPDGCRRYVLAIGTIEPRKDYPLLVSAFDAVAAAHPDVALVIVGSDGWGVERFDSAVAAAAARRRGSSGRAIWTTVPSTPSCGMPRCWPTRPTTKDSASRPSRPCRPGSRSWPPRRVRCPRWSGDGAFVVAPGDGDALAALDQPGPRRGGRDRRVDRPGDGGAAPPSPGRPAPRGWQRLYGDALGEPRSGRNARTTLPGPGGVGP